MSFDLEAFVAVLGRLPLLDLRSGAPRDPCLREGEDYAPDIYDFQYRAVIANRFRAAAASATSLPRKKGVATAPLPLTK
jgi:hypothetical protein